MEFIPFYQFNENESLHDVKQDILQKICDYIKKYARFENCEIDTELLDDGIKAYTQWDVDLDYTKMSMTAYSSCRAKFEFDDSMLEKFNNALIKKGASYGVTELVSIHECITKIEISGWVDYYGDDEFIYAEGGEDNFSESDIDLDSIKDDEDFLEQLSEEMSAATDEIEYAAGQSGELEDAVKEYEEN